MASLAVSTSSNFQRSSDVYRSDDSDEKSMELSAQDMGYVKRLKIISVDLVLEIGNAKETCKALGQEIFNAYKNAAGGSSEAGKAAVLRIFNACLGIRQAHISQAWYQIGDRTWRWQQA